MTITSILAVFGALFGAAGLGGIMKTWLDHQRGKRKQTDDVAMNLVGRLEARVEKLETDAVEERTRCDAKLAHCASLIGVLRHRINNQRQMIYSLLHLFDMPAARRKDALAGIRSELASMEQAEALEKGIVATAAFAAEAAE